MGLTLVLDPGTPQTLNGYTYGGDNPVTNTDPTGLCPSLQCGGVPQPGQSGHRHIQQQYTPCGTAGGSACNADTCPASELGCPGNAASTLLPPSQVPVYAKFLDTYQQTNPYATGAQFQLNSLYAFCSQGTGPSPCGATLAHQLFLDYETGPALAAGLGAIPGIIALGAQGEQPGTPAQELRIQALSEQDLNKLEAAEGTTPAVRYGPGAQRAGEPPWPVQRGGNCTECAQQIQETMGGQRLTIKPSSSVPGAKFLGPSVNNTTGDWTYHEIVITNGRAYDSFTGPNGLPFSDYKAQFEYADAIDFGF